MTSGLAASQTQDTISRTSLLGLPAELIQHVLSFLGPFDLANVAQTCTTLLGPAYDDQIWQPRVNSNLAKPISTPGPAGSFRDLYIAHHPHWFLTKSRFWFGDSEPSGKLLLTRYDQQRGCIEAYTVVAQRGTHRLTFWEKDREVIIHSFDPKVSLDLHQPVIRLNVDSPKAKDPPNDYPSDRSYGPESLYSRETLMQTFVESGLYSSLMLCRNLPESAVSAGSYVWPPLRFPASGRTRNVSGDGYTSSGHRPSRYSEVSQNSFRLRKWVEYTGRRSRPNVITFSNSGGGLSMDMPPHFSYSNPTGAGGVLYHIPESISTYATLPESVYTPTPAKPWQGIWCGDYSGHGCEFLVVTQPDPGAENPLPRGMDWLRQWFRSGRRESGSSTASFVSAVEHQVESAEEEAGVTYPGRHADLPKDEPMAQGHDEVPTGRLEAIKLTGDINVPRGEYTFIAPDIGPGGFMRVADEDTFRGARIVRSAGHIASRGFRADQYTPSQLIMISHDRLAQFWEGFGHISYYQRVDLDKLMEYHP
ncbi:F-box domain containing [Lecanosticta acicola]|uniref:F-box domain containing n=1 Tax=Lecanosticta acicola TaxID=111012 RepID=A0AAI9EBS6_9PEZI|nr:F-box domain containing [Lecanosticta acicola]